VTERRREEDQQRTEPRRRRKGEYTDRGGCALLEGSFQVGVDLNDIGNLNRQIVFVTAGGAHLHCTQRTGEEEEGENSEGKEEMNSP
jgi:hypothetical protein